ncbi:cell division cycle-associated protein 7-like [Athalia rosae]|uniref:cell division cycle-associated protein 7-like n=1 Tax=Athalia rosae TaxID=37344 RepID=UPI0020334EBF|nr:cell division cycle-associated protein 7-like [Athalia rosae]
MADEDYDAIRRKNIAERNAFFSEFFKDLKKETADLKPPPVPLPKNSEDSEVDSNDENEPIRQRRKPNKKSSGCLQKKRNLDIRRKYNTRQSVKTSISLSDSEELVDAKDGKRRRKRPKLKVLFRWAVPFEREIAMMRWMLYGEGDEEKEEESEESTGSSNDEDDQLRRKVVHKISKSDYNPDNIRSPEEVTEEQLLNVAERSTGKIYCKTNGISCHQCRQKTLDTKTICRSGECIGIRGQFCGPCLRGRYGEDAVVALKDPNWVCPPCRGLCNCSICRKRNGQMPTGILAPIVQEEGYSSVMDYLESGNTENL